MIYCNTVSEEAYSLQTNAYAHQTKRQRNTTRTVYIATAISSSEKKMNNNDQYNKIKAAKIMNVKIIRKLYTRYISANWFVGHRNGSSSVNVFMKPFDDDDAITVFFMLVS